jgi:hypothetical protein
MAVNNFSTDGFVFTVNGRVIDDWGEAAQPYSDEPIDPRTALRRGQGGNAVRLDRINPGRRVTLSLNPGGADSAYMSGLDISRANITSSKQQIGTLEAAVGTEGAIVNDGTVGRGGTAITDDVYIIEFNTWSATKGGD